MHVEKIKYSGYDGQEHEDKFYFNLNETELIELNYSKKGGYQAWLERIVNEHDNTKIVPLVRQIILTSYGKKSDDGVNFIKSSQISDQFYHSDAYNKLFLKLFLDTNEFVKFCTDLIPKDLSEGVKQYINDADDPEAKELKELAGLDTVPSKDADEPVTEDNETN